MQIAQTQSKVAPFRQQLVEKVLWMCTAESNKETQLCLKLFFFFLQKIQLKESRNAFFLSASFYQLIITFSDMFLSVIYFLNFWNSRRLKVLNDRKQNLLIMWWWIKYFLLKKLPIWKHNSWANTPNNKPASIRSPTHPHTKAWWEGKIHSLGPYSVRTAVLGMRFSADTTWVIAPFFGHETHKTLYGTLYLSLIRMDILLSRMPAKSIF